MERVDCSMTEPENHAGSETKGDFTGKSVVRYSQPDENNTMEKNHYARTMKERTIHILYIIYVRIYTYTCTNVYGQQCREVRFSHTRGNIGQSGES